MIAHNGFTTQIMVNNRKVTYGKLSEIVQGGPEIGALLIDNAISHPGLLFSGPLLVYKEKYVLLPLYTKSILSSGFILVVINTDNCNIAKLTTLKPIILLERIEDNTLTYFTDLENKNKEQIKLEF